MSVLGSDPLLKLTTVTLSLAKTHCAVTTVYGATQPTHVHIWGHEAQSQNHPCDTRIPYLGQKVVWCWVTLPM